MRSAFYLYRASHFGVVLLVGLTQETFAVTDGGPPTSGLVPAATMAGLSAGGLVLTPTIALAGYPPFDCDANDVQLRNLSGLGLVRFEFFPHYHRSAGLQRALLRYSRTNRRPVYACRDGSGLVIEQDRFTAHGEVWLFESGRRLRIGA